MNRQARSATRVQPVISLVPPARIGEHERGPVMPRRTVEEFEKPGGPPERRAGCTIDD